MLKHNHTGRSDHIIEARVKHEVKAMQAVEDVRGFPTLNGVIVKKQRMCAIVMEFFHNHGSTKSYMLHDFLRKDGPRIENHQVLKVSERDDQIILISFSKTGLLCY